MLPITVAEAVVAARRADAMTRAEHARHVAQARAHAAQRGRPTLPPARRRRFRWLHRPVIRPA